MQYADKVEEQRQRLDQEQLDGQITMLDIRAGRIETRFASGRVVIEYPRDKRKKTKVFYDWDNRLHIRHRFLNLAYYPDRYLYSC